MQEICTSIRNDSNSSVRISSYWGKLTVISRQSLAPSTYFVSAHILNVVLTFLDPNALLIPDLRGDEIYKSLDLMCVHAAVKNHCPALSLCEAGVVFRHDDHCAHGSAHLSLQSTRNGSRSCSVNTCIVIWNENSMLLLLLVSTMLHFFCIFRITIASRKGEVWTLMQSMLFDRLVAVK